MPRIIIGLFFLVIGGVLFCSKPLIEHQEDVFFLRTEPYFQAPINPVQNTLTIRKDSGGKGHFGASRNGGRTHQGVDYLSAMGDPVMASKSGRVIVAADEKGYGNVVKILHPSGEWLSVYAHLSRINVQEGDWVPLGKVIGNIGKTGNANNPNTLPHIHFELRSFEIPKDPATVLNPELKVLKKY